MLLSRANLLAAEVALRDPKDPVLHQLRVEPDGTTVASDGTVLMAVGPVQERPAAFPDFPGEGEAAAVCAAEAGYGITPAVVAQAKRDMPRGALGLELGFAAVTGLDAGPQGGVKLTTTDLNRNLTVEGKKARRKFPEWRLVLREARGAGGLEAPMARVCVNRRALARLLHCLDQAAPDPEATVFIEIPADGSAGLVLRARNAATGQAVVGLAMSVNTRGAWLPLTPWEEGVFGVGPARDSGATPRKAPKRKEKGG